MTDLILTLNAGSSTIKYAAYDRFALDRASPEPVYADKIDLARGGSGARVSSWLNDMISGGEIAAIGHRVVHGGPHFAAPTRVTPELLAELETLEPLAPLHQPANLLPIRAILAEHPALPQVACFDTAFHRTHDPLTDRYALPAEFYSGGVRRYGFHGLSYEFIARALDDVAPDIADGRIIIAHLGSGASMCALHGGKSVDSTMGFTALDGLPMATRCGAIDPGVLLYLLNEGGHDAASLEQLLYRGSGLLGLSGLSGDIRTLAASDAPQARLAIDYLCQRIIREAGALMASLRGLDAIIFTAGIGEHDAAVRAAVCRGLGWTGLALDENSNAKNETRISRRGSSPSAWVIPTNEELMIAIHTKEILDA